MRTRRPKLVACALAIGLMAGCSPDYSAVRDWSMQARETVLPPASQRPPGVPIAVPAPPATVTEDGRAGAVRALQEAAGAWLAMLAYVAEDGLPRERSSQFDPLAERVRPVDADGARAVAALGETMAFAARRNWRAPALTLAVQRGDPDFQAIMAALLRLGDAPAETGATRFAHVPPDLEEVARGHAFLEQNRTRLSAAETARVLRLRESELRRLLEIRMRESGSAATPSVGPS